MITKVLITVKTYPSPSSKYGETVCTAGFTEDGRFIRIYPIPFRMLEEDYKYKKYQWCYFDIEKNKSDFRPESYRLSNIENIKLDEVIETKNDKSWIKRRDIVLKKVYTNKKQLISEAKEKDINKCVSLAVFRPKKILDFTIDKTTREWDKDKIDSIVSQGDLFDNKDLINFVKKLPYKFSYKFIDDENNISTLMIEDWELGQLYWNCFNRENNEKIACDKVRNKYMDIAKNKDVYLFLGTTKIHHNTAPNPFIIVGVFYPDKLEPSLF